jgi:hypothetical protein
VRNLLENVTVFGKLPSHAIFFFFFFLSRALRTFLKSVNKDRGVIAALETVPKLPGNLLYYFYQILDNANR